MESLRPVLWSQDSVWLQSDAGWLVLEARLRLVVALSGFWGLPVGRTGRVRGGSAGVSDRAGVVVGAGGGRMRAGVGSDMGSGLGQ